jgi:predicted ribosomally synthesized peptide with nif11-like leader
MKDMSKANLESFYAEVLRDSSLQERLTSVNESGNMAALAVGLGKEKGYDFTVAEVEAKVAELKQLPGGPVGPLGNGVCWVKINF